MNECVNVILKIKIYEIKCSKISKKCKNFARPWLNIGVIGQCTRPSAKILNLVFWLIILHTKKV